MTNDEKANLLDELCKGWARFDDFDSIEDGEYKFVVKNLTFARDYTFDTDRRREFGFVGIERDWVDYLKCINEKAIALDKIVSNYIDQYGMCAKPIVPLEYGLVVEELIAHTYL